MPEARTTDERNLVLRRQSAITRIAHAGLQASTLDDFLAEALQIAADTMDVPTVAVLELFADQGMLEGRAVIYDGETIGPEGAALVRVPTGRGSMPGYTLLDDRVVVTTDLVGDQRFVAVAPNLGIEARAGINAPLGWAGRPWGVLGVYDREVRSWTDDEVDFVQSVANTLGLAIRRQAVEDDLRASNIRLDLSLAAGGLGAWSWSGEARRVELNRSALDLHGITAETFAGTPDDYARLVHPEDRQDLLAAITEALQTGSEATETYRVVRPVDGEVRWFQSWGRIAQEPGRPVRLVGVCADITDQVDDEQRLEATLVAEKVARRQAEQAGARLATLSEASNLFSQSLEPEVILDALADFCVPLLADVCRVETPGPNGVDVTQVVRGVDQERVDALMELERLCPDRLGFVMHPAQGPIPDGSAAVPPTGPDVDPTRDPVADPAPLVFTDLGPDHYAAAAGGDPQHLAALQRLGLTSVVVAPLVARNQVIGRLTLIETDRHRRHPADHVAMVQDLASRAALALDNGRLYESRSRMVDSLQAVLVPRELPDPAGLHFAARYRAADPRDDVGGDFYDAFEIADDQWGVVVGDVCGHGPDAAALTGLIRHSVRAAAVRDARPLPVLSQTNDAVIDQLDDFRFCTATYMLVRETDQGACVTVSSAGHPRPVVVRAGGGAEPLACSGVLLGVVRRPSLVEVELRLHPGDAIVLYTDGVTEARGVDGLFGDDRLVEVLSSLAGRSADEIAAGLDDAVRSHRSGGDDDIAILVVQAAV